MSAVGVGQAFGLRDQVHGLRVGFDAGRGRGLDRLQRCQRQAFIAGLQGLQRAEDLRHGDPARRRWRHAADLPALVVGAQRRALLGLVVGEIGQGQAAGVGVALDLGGDFLGDRAFVQGIRAFMGDAFEHGGQCRVLQVCADGFWAAIGIAKVSHHFRGARHGRIRGDQPVQAWRNGEALFGELDGRFKQLRPGQASVFLMGQFQGAQHAGCAHRTTANLRLGEPHRLSVGLQEKLFGGAGRGGFTSVVGAHGLAIPEDDQCAAADARRLWLD
ncbi:hypothetical protein D3C80_784940 [compost metagenome]